MAHDKGTEGPASVGPSVCGGGAHLHPRVGAGEQAGALGVSAECGPWPGTGAALGQDAGKRRGPSRSLA